GGEARAGVGSGGKVFFGRGLGVFVGLLLHSFPGGRRSKGLDRGGGLLFSPFFFPQSRTPPMNALALLPRRHPGGRSLSFLTLPPPSTMSSGSRAPVSWATTFATCCRHFFLPRFLSPRSPTQSS